jgi:Rod binding domain-containing protein
MKIDIGSVAGPLAAAKDLKAKLGSLKQATQGIETLFLKQLLGVMRSSSQGSLFGDSSASKMYQDMFDDALAQQAGKRGSFGVGDLLYRQMAPKVAREVWTEHGIKGNDKINLNL